jgi:glycosyltransferase involved in cell wall biosynthesis
MKILMHCMYFPPEVGGLESHVYYLCLGLVNRGHEVTVVTSRSRPELPPDEEMEGIRVHRTWLPSRTPVGWTSHALASIPATRRRGTDADVLHAQAFASILPCAFARHKSIQPLVSTIHTSHFLRLAAKPALRPALKKLVEIPDYNFAASKEIADVAEGLGSRISVEPLANGVDTDFFRPVAPSRPRSPGVLRLVAPRRLFAKNGVEYLIRAVPLIRERLPIEVFLIGDGPERRRLEALARELGVGDSVRFLGARPHAEMPGLLCSADMAVFPSLMEATSVGALEAMACQLPVAASDVGGLPEIVDDDVGILFPPADPVGLAAAVTELVEQGELEAKGVLARQRVMERWSNDRLVDRHLEVYEMLLEQARTKGGHG